MTLALACDDQKSTTPVPTGTPTHDAGDDDDDDGWGDPSTTRRKGIVRLGHLNVRRYFDATCDSGNCEKDGFEESVTEAEFEARTAKLAAALVRLEADVITLAEVENQVALDALRDKLEELGSKYPVAYLAETGQPGSIDVGVLARGELGDVKLYRKDHPLTRPDGSKAQFTREFPELHLKLGDSAVVVFAAHFRSKNDDDPDRRLAEAVAAHEIMVEADTANTGALVLLGGDLNDVPGSDTIDAMEKDAALVRVAQDLPEAEQGTYRFGGALQAIDHIFTTASRATAYLPKSAKVVRDGTNQGLGGSDHAGLYADFKLP